MERTIQELVCLSQQDRAYSEQLWERLKPLCLKWAKKFNGEQEDIEGLYQESYLVLLKALEHYDPSSEKKFESYFKMVLYRWGRNYQNKKK
ncbi:MAG: sigma factor, partial [Niameybacter sp.]